MKKIWFILIAVIVVPSFAFVPQINAKDARVSPNDGWPTKEEIKKIAEDKTIETIRVTKGTFEPEVSPNKTPKFSVVIGLGNGFKLGEKKIGKFKGYDNSSPASIRLGYSLLKYIEIQGEYSGTNRFKQGDNGKWSDDLNGEVVWDYKNLFVFSSYTINLKMGFPIVIGEISFFPYVIGGIGKTRAKYSFESKELTNGTLSYHVKSKALDHGKSTKFGLGTDIMVYKNIYLFSEYNLQKIKSRMFNQNYTFYFSSTIGGIGMKF